MRPVASSASGPVVWLQLALHSALSRRVALGLVAAAVAVATCLILAVSQLRSDMRSGFESAVSGVDLVVGAPGSPTELLLYSVFHLGKPQRTMAFDAYERVVQMPQVRWAVPLQLGDSYRGYAVVGTTPMFFAHGAGGRPMRFDTGGPFAAVFDVVLGADVARATGHVVGSRIVLTHGHGDGLATDHEDTPFTVSGMLAPTGTPVDRSVIISLAGFEAMHVGWEFGSRPRMPRSEGSASSGNRPAQPGDAITLSLLQPERISAVLIGLEARTQVFTVRREIESLSSFRLMAVMPGVTLDQLWQMLSVVEAVLLVMAWLVAVSAALGVAATLLVAMSSRRREFAIFRALGASPAGILLLTMVESVMVCLAGILAGWLLLQVIIVFASDALLGITGIHLVPRVPDADAWLALLGLLATSCLAGLIPAWRAYRMALHDGLHPPAN
jgi:putative ABC transport system permease protein